MLLSIVVPVLNEAETVPRLMESLRQSLQDHPWEVIFVDDGSSDSTPAILKDAACADARIRLLRFTRNFGHQAAITAGLDVADGDAVVVMDADMQDPPELLPQMLALYAEGYDVVSPQRLSRAGEGLFKRWTAGLFYQFVWRMTDRRMIPDVGDFRLLSRRAVLALRAMREQHRYVRGMTAWLGMKEVTLPFARPARAAGHTKYSPAKMLRFAWTAVSSFSALPLRVSIAAGCLLSLAGFAYLLWVVYLALWTHSLVPGWASVVALQCVFSGMILLALGAIGDYVARTYEETKHRPLYVVHEACNLQLPASMPPRAIYLTEAQPRVNPSAETLPASYRCHEVFASTAAPREEMEIKL